MPEQQGRLPSTRSHSHGVLISDFCCRRASQDSERCSSTRAQAAAAPHLEVFKIAGVQLVGDDRRVRRPLAVQAVPGHAREEWVRLSKHGNSGSQALLSPHLIINKQVSFA